MKLPNRPGLAIAMSLVFALATLWPPAASAAEAAPVASFTTVATGLTVSFSDTSTGEPTAWAWDFGDGTASTDQHPTHAYGAGTYSVSLTASNDAGSSSSTAVLVVSPAPPGLPPWRGSMNLYRSGAFVGQKTWTWCVGAAAQMMLNLIAGSRDTSSSKQRRLMTYARANDTQSSHLPGSDPRGWAAAMTQYGAGTYRDYTFSTMDDSLRWAAKRMRVTGKPVGLLVSAGRHAWVLHGFSANRDPALTSNFSVGAVYLSGPLWPRQVARSGLYDLRPNTKLTRGQLSRALNRYRQASGWGGWRGKYVIVAP